MKRITSISIILLPCCWLQVNSAVTIDPGTEYQIIEGFGFGMSAWQISVYDNNLIMDRLITDLGANAFRFWPDNESESSNENGDAANLDLNAFNWTGGAHRGNVSVLNRIQSRIDPNVSIALLFQDRKGLIIPEFLKIHISSTAGYEDMPYDSIAGDAIFVETCLFRLSPI